MWKFIKTNNIYQALSVSCKFKGDSEELRFHGKYVMIN